MQGFWFGVVMMGCVCRPAGGELHQRPSTEMSQDRRQPLPHIARTEVQVWFVDQGAIQSGDDPWVQVARKVGQESRERNAAWALLKGPTPEERERGLRLIDNGFTGFEQFAIEDGVARIHLRGTCRNEGGTITVFDHLRRTLVAFPTIRAVKVYDAEGRTQDPNGPSDSRPACLEP